jgi:hypothetical protein
MSDQLGLDPAGDPEALRDQFHAGLRNVPGWLLIFDNADTAEDIRGWLPGGPLPPGIPGHVIVTTRRGRFSVLGRVLELDVIDLPSAVAMLWTRVPGLPREIAEKIKAVTSARKPPPSSWWSLSGATRTALTYSNA